MYTYFFISLLLHHYPFAGLTSNLSKANYIYPYYKLYKLCSDSNISSAVLRVIMQTLDTNSCYHHYLAVGKVQLPTSCIDDLLDKCCYKIIQV